MQHPDYPIHWIFDYFPRFTPDERAVALLVFDGKTVREMAYQLDWKVESVEKCLKGIAKKTRLGNHMNRRGIESGTFFRKWGFIHRKKPAPVDPMADPMF